MEWYWIFLILAVAVMVFGFGVVILNRRSAARLEAPPRPVAPPEAPPPKALEADDATAVEAPVVEPELVVEPEPAVEAKPPSLRQRLAKARSAFSGAFASVLGRGAIDDDTWDELEEALLRADVGLGVTDALLDDLKTRVKDKEITEPQQLLDALKGDMVEQLAGADRTVHFDESFDPGSPNVWMFVGVNGVGKTTTIGKVARHQVEAGRSVLLAAGDTFRAAAAEQLGTWAERSGTDFVRGAEGGDPSSVIFDGVERAASQGIDLVLADTAGRLHTKTNLMEELKKVRRVAEKGAGTVTETLLVIDATTGQNGMAQARQFGEATDVTGVVLTKLDGSAKGGIVFAIETELGIPVKLVGIGEQVDDLIPFDPEEFVAALFDETSGAPSAG
ncbi:MAG: signal recognition particle-docking protein FtsY [Ilumatobacter sp.]|uniref:signal recognition particle-docking protein FtsY n=1 Tax=Ilumatobacter sp. TaxID=1967498 RepID=UPI0026212EB7|nr:signal recognition particle-docking protein FtsY [Ilumatobacter sp.]MDJ0768266.1 signal recognition particle-docking protein FtsY [Ilumatobacter sp.]